MAFPKIIINRGKGGLGRPLPTNDHVSGLIMPVKDADLPSGFTATDRIKVVYSIDDAETLGIIENSTSDEIKHLYYQIDSFFGIQPKGKLYLYLYDSVSGFEFDELELSQAYANGEIRQFGLFLDNITIAGNVSSLQTEMNKLESNNTPASVLLAMNFGTITESDFQAGASALVDLRAMGSKNVSVVLGGDGSAKGGQLSTTIGFPITTLGLTLGAVSLSKVHENIGWIEKFNVVNGTEFDEPVFAIDSSKQVFVKDQQPLLNEDIHDRGYIFLRKQVGINGSYHTDSGTAISVTSDYAYIENNRVIDKAVRNVRTKMLPNLNSPLYVNEDGTLSGDTIGKFQNDAENGLESMERDGEISAFKVIINPEQDVLSTSKIEIAIKIVPVGVAREIDVNIGFAVSVS